MPTKAKLIICLGVALAPCLPMPAFADEVLTVKTIVSPPSGQIIRSFDISWVDSKLHTYALAASALNPSPTAIGPASNPAIVIVDTLKNAVVDELGGGASTPFAGSCVAPKGRDMVGFSGPNGVIIVEKGKGTNEVWAADGPIVSPPCPINPAATGPGSGLPNQFTGSITLTTLTDATAPAYGAIAVGQTLIGPNVAPHTTITGSALSNSGACTPSCTGNGTNAGGTYAVSVSQTAASEEMSAFSIGPAGTRHSQVVVFDLITGAVKAKISTGGSFRADELCYAPSSNGNVNGNGNGNGKGVVLVANDEAGDLFVTFIDTSTYTVIQTMHFDGTDPNANNINATGGIEQCQFNPRDGNFYLNIPGSTTGGHTLRISQKNKNSPFTVTADFNSADVTACAPNGLAVGPAGQLGLGCSGNPPNEAVIISDIDGSTVSILPGLGRADEDWYNPGSNHYYFAASSPADLGVADAGNRGTSACNVASPPAGCPASDGTIPTASGSHSVAADSVLNTVFVPIRAGNTPPPGTLVCSSGLDSVTGLPGSDTDGCIAVYTATNDSDDVAAGNGNGNGQGNGN